jgi:aspartyl-tRNA(Asn)/glutamyl-tRNA(Gln) amidotransferase subunit C
MAKHEFDIDTLAKLSMLRVTEEEKAELQESLPSILDYISKLQEVDTSNLDAKAYLTEEQNVFREDSVIADETERQAIIAGFPKKKGDALEVPAIFE